MYQLDLPSEFQVTQSYMERQCLKTKHTLPYNEALGLTEAGMITYSLPSHHALQDL